MLMAPSCSDAASDFSVAAISSSYGGSFVINGQGGNPSFTLMRGRTYTFTVATGSTHPFQVVTGFFATPYNAGISNNNISNGTLTFSVSESTPDTLRYVCSIHFFGGTINIVDPPDFRILSIGLATNNVVLKSRGTNGWSAVPEFSSNLTSSSWAVVPEYTNTFLNGTNVTIFNRLEPICGPNVFLRVRNTRN
jgi:hypothetical protein